MTTCITIDLLRHGEAAAGKKLLGVTDEPLTELGWQQMQAVVQSKDAHFDFNCKFTFTALSCVCK